MSSGEDPLTVAIRAEFPGLAFHLDAITDAARTHGLDPLLVVAIVLQESAANTDGFRHERNFWNRYLKSRPEWAQANPRRVSSSYGLMQVMYPVAVERGLSRAMPPEALFVPALGLAYGCLQLRWLSDKMDAAYPLATVEARRKAVLASYNGGFQGPDALRPDNRLYAESVLRHFARLQTELPTPKV